MFYSNSKMILTFYDKRLGNTIGVKLEVLTIKNNRLYIKVLDIANIKFDFLISVPYLETGSYIACLIVIQDILLTLGFGYLEPKGLDVGIDVPKGSELEYLYKEEFDKLQPFHSYEDAASALKQYIKDITIFDVIKLRYKHKSLKNYIFIPPTGGLVGTALLGILGLPLIAIIFGLSSLVTIVFLENKCKSIVHKIATFY